jgi:hypothetical protein
MADVSEVADGLVQIVAAAAYPNGTSQPSIGACDIMVYQGWPNPQTLDADMAAGKVHISVFPRPGDTITSIMMGDVEWSEATNNGTTGTSTREVRRQNKQFQITIWAPTPTLRDTIAKKVDLALAVTSRFTMADGSQSVLTYVNATQSDSQQKVSIYRRDLFYAVNYALVQDDAEFTILETITNITTAISDTDSGRVVTVHNP